MVSPRPQRPGTTNSDHWTTEETDAIITPSKHVSTCQTPRARSDRSEPSSLWVYPAKRSLNQAPRRGYQPGRKFRFRRLSVSVDSREPVRHSGPLRCGVSGPHAPGRGRRPFSEGRTPMSCRDMRAPRRGKLAPSLGRAERPTSLRSDPASHSRATARTDSQARTLAGAAAAPAGQPHPASVG